MTDKPFEFDFSSIDDSDDPEHSLPPLNDVMRSLPFIDEDHYIGMQAMNLAIVDSMIEPMEDDLRGEYLATDRLPFDRFLPVSALSQLWIFGVYELLRTWRQWMDEVLRRSEEIGNLPADLRKPQLDADLEEMRKGSPASPGGMPYVKAFERAVVDAAYRESLRDALYRSDLPFRRIESVRVYLAKHEVPKGDEYASGAGYGRIDIDGSIQFHVPLGKNEVTMISRRSIALDLRGMADGRPLFVLSPAMQKVVSKLRLSSYGIQRVRMKLDDGNEFEGAIAWKRHIVWVKGHVEPPFEASRVVEIERLPDE